MSGLFEFARRQCRLDLANRQQVVPHIAEHVFLHH